MFKKDKIVFSTNPHTALSSFPQEALEDVVVVGCLGSVSDIQRLCSLCENFFFFFFFFFFVSHVSCKSWAV
jgi:hypothetical protein